MDVGDNREEDRATTIPTESPNCIFSHIEKKRGVKSVAEWGGESIFVECFFIAIYEKVI